MSDKQNPELHLARVERPEEALTAAPAEYDGLRFVVSPAEAKRRLDELAAFVKTVMVPGLNGDYAIIPGTNKPTLLQPGAQKLCEVYGFSHAFVDVAVVEDWERGFFFYRKRCVLTSRRDGRFICDGVGSCNSKEDRYAGRWANEDEVPTALDKAKLRRKVRDTKRGKWMQYRIPNDDPYSLVNTIEKMACKRALVHAVQGATRSAGIFTQDLDHLEVDESAIGEAEETRSWNKPDEDTRSVAEKVKTFEVQLDAAKSKAEVNKIAAEIAKSDLPMSAGAPLRQRTLARLSALDPKKQPPKPAEPEKKPEPEKKTAPRNDEVDEHGYSLTGDPEPDLPERQPGEE